MWDGGWFGSRLTILNGNEAAAADVLNADTIKVRDFLLDTAGIASNKSYFTHESGTLEVMVQIELGGAQEAEEGVRVTPPAEVAETIAITRDAFGARGLDDAWRRVIAVVAQPGVEFGDANLFEYDREAARDLSRFIEGEERLVFEAHSTDYQTPGALRRLVEDHFAILKVGPALTFAFREAVFALVMMEEERLAGRAGIELSHLRETLDAAMLANPVHWRKYYGGDEQAQAFARKYSFSDRSRYYWPVPEVQAALARLLRNLEENPPPLSLLSQFAPVQYGRIRAGRIANSPRAIILDRIGQVLEEYAYACGATPHS
jgi:D-tagatose-1,6-bisphosphate aldolase subunit GatZ/KbaZ